MITKPVTYAFNYSHTDEVLRPYIFHAMAESGIKNIVLSIDLMASILKDGNLVAALMAETAAAGLKFVDSHAQFGGFYDLRTVNDSSLEHVVHLQQLQIAIAAEMGVSTITIHPGADALNPEIPLEKQTENVIRTLDRILPVAESLGVTVCIENSWSRLSRPNNLIYIKSKFPTDALGFCYDAGHTVLSLNGRTRRLKRCCLISSTAICMIMMPKATSTNFQARARSIGPMSCMAWRKPRVFSASSARSVP